MRTPSRRRAHQPGRAARAVTGAAATVALAATGAAAVAAPAQARPGPDLGPNVTVFDPTWSVADINAALQAASHESEFSTARHAFLFAPGTYGSAAGAADPASATGVVNGQLGYYETVAGLGASPDDVVINGAIHVEGRGQNLPACPWDGEGDSALVNFWRSLSNMAINPIQQPVPGDTGTPGVCYPSADNPDGLMFPEGVADAHQLRWAVSQAAPLRRVHVRGDLSVFPRFGGYSSGGFIADSVVDGALVTGSQQQWYTRDSSLGSFQGGVWNMVFSGVQGAPATNFGTGTPAGVLTSLGTTAVSRGAPFLYLSNGEYRVFVPNARHDSAGVQWATDAAHGTSVPLSRFYVARQGDSARTLNAQLAAGKNVLLTPGVYELDRALRITRPGTVVLGLGMASLTPTAGTAAIQVGDVPGVKIAGITVDAGTAHSDVLVQVGPPRAHVSNPADPTTLSDVYIRVGGPRAGNVTTAIEVNSPDTLLDHIWSWRADHGTGASWTGSTGAHGLVVNGARVTATGLFVEHYQANQVLWNGQDGRTVFYQSELPYEVPNQAAWMDGSRNGFASYRVADSVTRHSAVGMGVYSFFNQGQDVWLESAVQVPRSRQVTVTSATSVFLNGSGGITHVVNDAGAATANADGKRTVQLVSYPPADTAAPTVTVTPDPATPDGASGWYRTPVTLRLAATDDYLPSPRLEAQVDGGAWLPARGSLRLGDGRHSVLVRAVDDSGNRSAQVTWAGNVDSTGPRVSAALAAGTLTLTGVDALSGVARIDYAVMASPWAVPSRWSTYTGPVQVGGGARTVSYRAWDVAGNLSFGTLLLVGPHAGAS